MNLQELEAAIKNFPNPNHIFDEGNGKLYGCDNMKNKQLIFYYGAYYSAFSIYFRYINKYLKNASLIADDLIKLNKPYEMTDGEYLNSEVFNEYLYLYFEEKYNLNLYFIMDISDINIDLDFDIKIIKRTIPDMTIQFNRNYLFFENLKSITEKIIEFLTYAENQKKLRLGIN